MNSKQIKFCNSIQLISALFCLQLIILIIPMDPSQAAGESPIFNVKSVLQHYNQIQYGRTRKEKDEANRFIVLFIASDQAWPLALELLTAEQAAGQGANGSGGGGQTQNTRMNDTIQEHFIGAQALYQKLDKDFDAELAGKDQLVLELRDKLFGLLSPQQQPTPRPAYHKTVIERLCMSLAYLALHTTNTCWQTSIPDVISYGGGYGPAQCFISLNILKNVCITFENKMFNQKQTALIKRWFRENVNGVFEYANKILSGGGDLPHEVYLECLSVAKHWCTYSHKTFIINEQFVQTLLHLLANDTNMNVFKKIINILKKMLTSSDHVRLLSNMRFEHAIKPEAMPEKDLLFIRHIIDFLYTSKEKYQACTADKMYSLEEDDEEQMKAVYAQKFTQLLMALCQNYELMFVVPHNFEWARKLYELLMIGSRAKNLNIVVQITEFWADFKQTLIDSVKGQNRQGQPNQTATILQELDAQMQLCSPYLQACEILLEQSQLVAKVHQDTGLLLEIDEDEQEEIRGMTTRSFRQFVEDVYLQAYFLLCDVYQQDGANRFCQMFLQKLESSQQNILAIEACLFMLKSIEPALKDDESSSSINFAQQVFDQLLSESGPFFLLLKEPRNVLLKRGFCQLVQEMASFFTKFPQLVNPALQLILSMKDSQALIETQNIKEISAEGLEALYTQTIMELCQHCPQFFSQQEFLQLKNHLTQGASTMSAKNVSCLMESICYVCTKQEDQNALKLALDDICSIPLSFMQQIQSQNLQSIDQSHLLKAMSMITGAIKALQELSEAVLEQTLLPMIRSVWEQLMCILSLRALEKDLIVATCKLVQNSIGILAKSLISLEFFNNLSTNLINCFKSNSQNVCCLQTFSYLCSKTGRSNEELTQSAMMYFDAVFEMILQHIGQVQNQAQAQTLNVDVDLLKEFALVMLRCGEMDLAHLITSKYFNDSLLLFSNTLELVHSQELNQQLVQFFTYLLNTVSIKFQRQGPQVQEAFMAHYSLILKALMQTLSKPNVQRELSMIATAFQNAINWAEQGGFEQKLRDEFLGTFSQSNILSRTVSVKLQKTVVYILFGLRLDQRKMRLCLLQLNNHITSGAGERSSLTSENEAFFGLELEAQKAITNSKLNSVYSDSTEAGSGQDQQNRVVILD